MSAFVPLSANQTQELSNSDLKTRERLCTDVWHILAILTMLCSVNTILWHGLIHLIRTSLSLRIVCFRSCMFVRDVSSTLRMRKLLPGIRYGIFAMYGIGVDVKAFCKKQNKFAGRLVYAKKDIRIYQLDGREDKVFRLRLWAQLLTTSSLSVNAYPSSPNYSLIIKPYSTMSRDSLSSCLSIPTKQ